MEMSESERELCFFVPEGIRAPKKIPCDTLLSAKFKLAMEPFIT